MNLLRLQRSFGFFFVGIFLLSLALEAKAQDPLGHIRDLWNEGTYTEAVPLLLDYRKGPYGKIPEVDYMLATSNCRREGTQDLGYWFFEWIIYNYPLPINHLKVIQEEKGRCGVLLPPPRLDFAGGSGQAGVSGKTFYWVGENNAFGSAPAETIKVIPFQDIQHRLFTQNQTSAAVHAIEELAGPKFQVFNEGPFIIASRGSHSSAQLKNIGQLLGDFLRFFVANFELPKPKYLITVYLVDNRHQLQGLAETIHGLRISSSTIGYNFPNDRSLVAVIPGTHVGSLAHELFHLLVKEQFGDIPMWMDEGLASLYEVSRVTVEGEAKGVENWRRRVLEQLWRNRPSIKKLVVMTPAEFSEKEGGFELEIQAANHAMARYFMLWLQDTGKLEAMYRAFRDREIGLVHTDPKKGAVKLIEAVSQKSIHSLDEDFVNWFQNPSTKKSSPKGKLVPKHLPSGSQ